MSRSRPRRDVDHDCSTFRGRARPPDTSRTRGSAPVSYDCRLALSTADAGDPACRGLARCMAARYPCLPTGETIRGRSARNRSGRMAAIGARTSVRRAQCSPSVNTSRLDHRSSLSGDRGAPAPPHVPYRRGGGPGGEPSPHRTVRRDASPPVPACAVASAPLLYCVSPPSPARTLDVTARTVERLADLRSTSRARRRLAAGTNRSRPDGEAVPLRRPRN